MRRNCLGSSVLPRAGRHLSSKHVLDACSCNQVTLAWTFNLLLNLICSILSLTFGVVKFKASGTSFMVVGWVVAMFQTYLIIEPMQESCPHSKCAQYQARSRGSMLHRHGHLLHDL